MPLRMSLLTSVFDIVFRTLDCFYKYVLFEISTLKVRYIFMLLRLYGFPIPGKHTIFGRVSKGMEIVKRLGSVQTDKSDR